MRGGCLAVGMIVALTAAPADAATRFAAPGGSGPSGPGGCLEANPCAIEPAIEDAAVVNGDTIKLLPGTYSVAAATLTVVDQVTIEPRDPGTRPLITGTNATLMQLGAAATLRDVALQNATSVGNGAGLFVSSPSGAVVERVRVESTINDGGNGEFACAFVAGTLRDSVCRMIEAASGAEFGVALGTSVNSGTGTFQSTFVNVTAVGSGTFTGLLARSTNTNLVTNVTAHNVIASNVIASTNNNAGSEAHITLTNSNYPSSGTAGTGTSVTAAGPPTNQTAAPLFVNAAAGDFRQAPGSPTINAGAPWPSVLGTQDLDFETRIQGPAPDIGADEFNVPATPAITDTDPNSPANDNNPEVKGTAVAGSTVKIFSTADCTGSPLATGTAGQFTAGGITTPVGGDATTNLRATANDSLDHASACSAAFPYTEDSTAPAAPQITDTDPDSPANDNNPEVEGIAEAGSTVRVHSSSDCSGSPLATGTAAAFAFPGLTVGVADNTTTNLRATATDAAGNVSACSAAETYVENSSSQPPATDTKAPQTAITKAPKPTLKTKKKTAPFAISFNADEAALFTCSLDGATPKACSSPFEGKAKKGAHSFEVTATDAAGNRDASPATATFKVKVVKPRR